MSRNLYEQFYAEHGRVPYYDLELGKYAMLDDGAPEGVTVWEGLDKELSLPELTGGVPTVAHIERTRGSGIKLAGAKSFPKELLEYAKNLKEDPRYEDAAIHNVGAGESVGMNVNGDRFPRLGLSHSGPQYGHKTFESGGRLHLHHVNKDPAASLGPIVFAYWDPEMDRITTIGRYLKEKAPDICARLRKGEPIPSSMGCKVPWDICVPIQTLIRMGDGTTRRIGDVQPGDEVLTHRGRARRVTRTFQSSPKPLREVRFHGTDVPLQITANHPVFAISKPITCFSRKRTLAALTKGIWKPSFLPAGDLKPGDLVFSPIDREVVDDPQLRSSSLARLFGFYLAEGSILRQRTGKKKDGPYRDMGVEWTFNIEERVFVEEIERCCENLGLNAPTVHERPDRNAVAVHLYAQDLAALLREHCGSGSRGKALSSNVLKMPPSWQIALLGAYLNGDGSVDKTKFCGRGISVNEGLIRDLQRLAWRCDILATSAHITTNSTWTPDRPTDAWLLFIGRHELSKLRDWVRVTGTPLTKPVGRMLIWGDYLVTQVASVVDRPNAETLYNLAVEEDESYVAAGLAVHNCTAKTPKGPCGVKAKNDSERCKHAPYFGRTEDDGSIIAMDNIFPRFFEQSAVLRGADKTSHILGNLRAFLRKLMGEPTEKQASIWVMGPSGRNDISEETEKTAAGPMPQTGDAPATRAAAVTDTTAPEACTCEDKEAIKPCPVHEKSRPEGALSQNRVHLASEKESSFIKEVPAMGNPLAEAARRTAAPLIDTEKRMDTAALAKLSEQYGPADITATLTSLGVMLLPEEFIALNQKQAGLYGEARTFITKDLCKVAGLDLDARRWDSRRLFGRALKLAAALEKAADQNTRTIVLVVPSGGGGLSGLAGLLGGGPSAQKGILGAGGPSSATTTPNIATILALRALYQKYRDMLSPGKQNQQSLFEGAPLAGLASLLSGNLKLGDEARGLPIALHDLYVRGSDPWPEDLFEKTAETRSPQRFVALDFENEPALWELVGQPILDAEKRAAVLDGITPEYASVAGVWLLTRLGAATLPSSFASATVSD